MLESVGLGHELRRLRRAQGLTQAEVAERAGVARSSVVELERGKPTIEVKTLLAVAAVLRHDVSLASNVRPSETLARRRDEILRAAQELDITDVRVFGSSARGDDGPSSDIDLLIHSPEGTHPGVLEEFRELVEELTGFAVDVVSDRLPGAKYDRIREAAVPL